MYGIVQGKGGAVRQSGAVWGGSVGGRAVCGEGGRAVCGEGGRAVCGGQGSVWGEGSVCVGGRAVCGRQGRAVCGEHSSVPGGGHGGEGTVQGGWQGVPPHRAQGLTWILQFPLLSASVSYSPHIQQY